MSRSDLIFIAVIVTLMFLFLGEPDVFDALQKSVITSANDNGCSKPTQIELSQTKSNADVYNYAALSTSYNK